MRRAGQILVALIAAGIALPAAGAPAHTGALIQLAQFRDPSLPIMPKQDPGRSRRDQPERASPFALPTTALPRSSRATTGGGGGNAGEAPEIPGAPEYPPYEKEMARLAEILGSMHYLGGLCGNHGDQWRGQMQALLDAESPAPAWRARLVGSFNEGYRGFERTYRTCTPAAERAVSIYLAEGEELTGTIKARYAN